MGKEDEEGRSSKRGIKILCFSDLHSWPFSEHARYIEGSGQSRYVNSIETLKYVARLERDLNPDYTVFLGDLWDRANPDPDYVHAVVCALRRFRKLIIVDGNHDLGVSGIHSLTKYLNIPGAFTTGYHTIEATVDHEPVRIGFIGYDRRSNRLRTRIRTFVKGGGRWVLFAHCGLADVPYRGLNIKEDKVSRRDLNGGFTVLGHWHDIQDLGSVVFVGSAQHRDRSDTDKECRAILVNIGRKTRCETYFLPKIGRYLTYIPGINATNSFLYVKTRMSDKKLKKIRKEERERGNIVIYNYYEECKKEKNISLEENPANIIRKVAGTQKETEVGLGIYGKVLGGV